MGRLRIISIDRLAVAIRRLVIDTWRGAIPMKRPTMWLMAVLVITEAGCAQFQDYANERLIAARNQHLARRAWRSMRYAYPAEAPYARHFRRGFLAGYVNVASGGNGCPPVLPPKEYWGACYQTPEGREKILTWFDGFHQGALVAAQDGVGNWTEIPTSLPCNVRGLSRRGPYAPAMTPGAPSMPPVPPPAEAQPPTLVPAPMSNIDAAPIRTIGKPTARPSADATRSKKTSAPLRSLSSMSR
jgi:hypothetical protein